jgi:hypothetical protein
MLRSRTLGIGFASLAVVAMCVCTADAQPQRGQRGPQRGEGGQRGGGPGGGGPGGFMQGPGGMGLGGMMGPGGVSLMLLSRPDVQEELDLLPSQIEELPTMQSIMGDFRGQFADVPQEERMERMREVMESAQKRIQEQTDNVLLPHQSDRLKQLAVQWQMRSGGGLASREVAEQLGISDQQRDQLREKARLLEQELRKKMQDELIKELTPQQQAKVKELVGEPFEFQQEEIRRPQRGADGPAGAGAAGGRRRGN